MQINRVKELRIARGLTLAALADLVDLSHTHISRIENGKRGLSIPIAEKLARVMNTTVAEIIGSDELQNTCAAGKAAFREDATPYDGASVGPLPIRPVRSKNVDPWHIKSNALDLAGIKAGMIVFVDISADAVDNITPLQCVVAQIYNRNSPSAQTVVRQFIPPSLLITNSSEVNEVPLDIDKGQAFVKGVIIGKYQEV